MHPSQSLPQASANEDSLASKVSESSGTFVKNNYESFLRKMMGVIYSLISFIRSSIVNIIGQILNKE
jgi:hypothetical protein